MQKKAMGMLLAAAAAYGYYRYSKMTPEERKNMMEKGKQLFNENFGRVGDLFGKKTDASSSAGNAN